VLTANQFHPQVLGAEKLRMELIGALRGIIAA
jgi:hypothetical protein